MVQSLQLGNSNQSAEDKGMKRSTACRFISELVLRFCFLQSLFMAFRLAGCISVARTPTKPAQTSRHRTSPNR